MTNKQDQTQIGDVVVEGANPFPSRVAVSARRISLASYALTTLSMATIGTILPIAADMAVRIGIDPSEVGRAIAFFSIPSALFALIIGQFCDRWGARPILLGGGLLAIVGDVLLFLASSSLQLSAAILITGIAFSAIVVSTPAVLIAMLDGVPRIRALSLWSTYAPVGVAAGLLLGAPFTGERNWPVALLLHSGLMTVALLAALLVFKGAKPAVIDIERPSLREMSAIFRHLPVIRLALAMAIPSAISYGVSLLAPSYINTVHGVSMASASTAVAASKILVVISGGLFSGWVLARAADPKTILVLLAITGLLGQVALFYPGGGFPLAFFGLSLWLFCYAAIAAIIMAQLPLVFPHPAQMGAASGLVSQTVSCACFLAPLIYFGDRGEMFYILLCVTGMLLTALAMPRGRIGG